MDRYIAGQVGSAAVSGGLGLIGSLIQYGLNKKLAAQQNQYNIDMWKLQAEYDSPQAQMQRFAEAGLNPNLIYGQGSNGNMSQAPQMVTPEAPNLSRDMQELGKAFNIANIRRAVADADIAEQNAKSVKIDTERKEAEWSADQLWSNSMTFDPATGMFVKRKIDPNNDGTIPVFHKAAYRFQQRMADNYYRQALIPYRQALLDYQKKFLVPQVVMSNYEASHYPTSYWIGQGSKVLNSLTSIPATFSPLKWVPRTGASFNRSTTLNYNY